MPKRFRVLRIIATIYKVSAWIILVVATLFALGTLGVGALNIFGGQGSPNAPGFGLLPIGGLGLGALGILLGGLLYFLFLYGAGELIYLGLAIEENTRESTLLLRETRQMSLARPPSMPELQPPPPMESLPPA